MTLSSCIVLFNSELFNGETSMQVSLDLPAALSSLSSIEFGKRKNNRSNGGPRVKASNREMAIRRQNGL